MSQTEHEAYKFCPRCASPAPVERGALRCAACGLDMYLSQKTGSCFVLMDAQGRLCVTRRARDPYKGMLDAIGGFIDLHESFEDCARREMKEEAGLDITADRLQYVGSESHPYVRKGIMLFVVAAYFKVTVTDAEKEAMVPQDDVASFEWYYPHELHSEDFYSLEIYRMLSEI